MSGHTRRSALKVMSSSIALATIPGATSAASGWTSVSSPVATNLYDVEYAADGAYAVGGGGDVLERTSNGWKQLLDGGATGGGNDLRGADVTDDEERLWFVGNSGEVGEYDVSTGTLYDHSAPMGNTNNFNDVAVTGSEGSANVYVVDQSGTIFYNFSNGSDGYWHKLKPGSGAELTAVDCFGKTDGHAVDTSQNVFETTDGETWTAIGYDGAGVNFYGVDSDGFDDVWVCGGNGMVFHWNGSKWNSNSLGDTALMDVEITTDDRDGYAVGGGGAVYDLTDGTWSQVSTPTGANLNGVVRGSPDIAVGASGSIIEN